MCGSAEQQFLAQIFRMNRTMMAPVFAWSLGDPDGPDDPFFREDIPCPTAPLLSVS
jgi:hypothetical protein